MAFLPIDIVVFSLLYRIAIYFVPVITKAKVFTFDNMNAISKIPFIVFFAAALLITPSWAQLSLENSSSVVKPAKVKRFLYVAVPGIRNYLEYGGHGILVYDLSDDYRLVKRIGTGGLKADGTHQMLKA